MKQSKQERSNWRDKALSNRHRDWGYNCPAVDLDFLLLEFNHGKAVAFIEYKGEDAKDNNTSEKTYSALVDVGDRASLPVFKVDYGRKLDWFQVTALNEIAKKIEFKATKMSELEFVTFLYKLRNSIVPESVQKILKKEIGLQVLQNRATDLPTKAQVFEWIKANKTDYASMGDLKVLVDEICDEIYRHMLRLLEKKDKSA